MWQVKPLDKLCNSIFQKPLTWFLFCHQDWCHPPLHSLDKLPCYKNSDPSIHLAPAHLTSLHLSHCLHHTNNSNTKKKNHFAYQSKKKKSRAIKSVSTKPATVGSFKRKKKSRRSSSESISVNVTINFPQTRVVKGWSWGRGGWCRGEERERERDRTDG